LKRNCEETKLVEFLCSPRLLERIDEKIRQEGIYRSRTELLLALLRKYVGAE